MARLKRKIDDFLLDWKNNKDRLPLIVKGARQIGKTDAIENKVMICIFIRMKKVQRRWISL